MPKPNHARLSETTATFRLTQEEKQSLADLAALHQTTDSKVLRAFLALPKHYPKINSAIAQFV
jgi:hypothetical protein